MHGCGGSGGGDGGAAGAGVAAATAEWSFSLAVEVLPRQIMDTFVFAMMPP